MIKRVECGRRVTFVHVCAVPYKPPADFHYQYGGLVSYVPFDDVTDTRNSGIVFEVRSQCWSLDCDEYASPIKHCPLCGVDLLEVEGRPS